MFLIDAILFWELLKICDVMIFDDYGWLIYSHIAMVPKPAIDKFLTSYSCMYKVLHKGYQMHIQKISDNPENAQEDCSSKRDSLLYDYATKNNFEGVKSILENGVNKNVQVQGVSAFEVALQQEHNNTAQMLAGSIENFCQ